MHPSTAAFRSRAQHPKPAQPATGQNREVAIATIACDQDRWRPTTSSAIDEATLENRVARSRPPCPVWTRTQATAIAATGR